MEGAFDEIINYMLENDCKLGQEAVELNKQKRTVLFRVLNGDDTCFRKTVFGSRKISKNEYNE